MGYRDYSTAKGHIVDALGHGDFTTISAAITAASSGQTIFIRPGTYTENPTLKAGVDLVAFVTDSDVPNVIINGTCTFTAAGTVGISGIQLRTNSSFALTVSGSAASIVYMNDCFLNCLNNTGIDFTSSSASSEINITDCTGVVATTGIAYFTHSSAGSISITDSVLTNPGGSTTASTCSSGIIAFIGGLFNTNISVSGTGQFESFYGVFGSLNSTFLTLTTTTTCSANFSSISSGTASCVSIGASSTFDVDFLDVSSSNTNVLTGSGILNYGIIVYTNTSSGNNVTTQTQFPLQPSVSGGVVKQVRSISSTYTTTTTVLPVDNTIPQNTEGTQILSVSITPTSASHVLQIQVVVQGSASVGVLGVALFQDATANALAAASSSENASTSIQSTIINYEMAAGTTSSTTFNVRSGPGSAGSGFINGNSSSALFGGVLFSSIFVTEYAT